MITRMIQFVHPVMIRRLFAVALAATFAGYAAQAKPALVSLKVFPDAVNLAGSGDRQSLVVQAAFEDGVTRDVTAEAKFKLADAARAALKDAVLTPLSDGKSELTVEFGGKRVVVPVDVAKASERATVSFIRDVVPVLSKTGCNAGSCHGSARGKDGFHLSLFGYDPADDHFRITREQLARRVNLAVPEASLLLEKGAGQVPHTGGQLFVPGDEYYATVLEWLRGGALADATKPPHVERLELYPPNAVMETGGAVQRFTVRAVYSDGSDRDVTSLAVFLTNNDVAAAVDKGGAVTAKNRGEAFITARFEAHTVGSQVIVIPKGQRFDWPAVEERNYVDTLVHSKLKKLRIIPSEVCDDATFLRRVHLDLTGTLPTPDEVRRFTSDASTGKREAIVDELLKRPEFVDMWTMKWAELLQVRSQDQILQFSYKSAFQYFEWLHGQIAANVPLDQMVKSLLTATGGSFENPAANFYKVERDTLKTAENVAQVFMGMRIQCAQCHNHPFDRWTMDDYYGFAAFFAQVGRKSGEDPRETVVYNSGGGRVRHPVGGRDVPPRFLGAEQPDVAGRDRREVLAGWLASPDNPWFAQNIANIAWAHFFGRGIVDPVDDVRVSNPASNPELLAELGRRLATGKYDLRSLCRDICLSRTYQLSTATNETNADDTANFSHAYVRRIRAEVLLDAIGQTTGAPEKIRGLPSGSSAIQIADGRTSTYFLTTFGRATRETPCSCEVRMEPNLSQALHLLNGDTVNQKVQSGGLVKKLLKEGATRDAVLDELYLRALARVPTVEERAALEKFFTGGKADETVFNDIFWSLLNAKEFVFNH